MDFEQLGVFYLGREVDPATMERTEQPLLYDSSDLTTHAVIVGMTGSGKTGLGVGLIEEAAIDGIPVLAIDPKGDLGNLALTFPELRPQDFEPWIDPKEAERSGVEPAEYAAQQARTWREGLASWGQGPERIQRFRDAAEVVVYTPGSSAGRPISVLRSFAAPPRAVLDDADLLSERLSSTVTGLLTLLGENADPLSREQILLSSILEHAWRAGRDLSLADLIHAVQDPPVRRLGVMDVDTVFPAKDRMKLALAINALVASPTFDPWTRGEALDVQSLLYGPDGRARVAVVSIAHLSDAERSFFLSLLLTEVVAWTRSQSGTSSLRALVYIDELFGFLPPVAEPPTKKPLMTLLKQARAHGVGLALATQNPVDLDYKALSNAGTWFVGRLQTERDNARLLEGLTAAAPRGASGAELNDIIGRVGSRTFLLHNVHEKEPAVFQTRWVLSYLAGPLTRDQIVRLGQVGPAESGGGASAPSALAEQQPTVPPLDPETGHGLTPPVNAASSVAATSAADSARGGGAAGAASSPVVGASAARPFLPPGVPQLHVPPRRSDGELAYFPVALGVADVHYVSKTHGVDHTERVTRVAELREGVVGLDWNDGEAAGFALEDLAREPEAGVAFQPLPAVKLDAAAVKEWTSLLQRWLRVDGALTLHRFAELKLVAAPGESEQEFRLRCAQALRERRDAEKEKIRSKYDKRATTLERRLLQRQQAVERESQVVQQRRLDAAVTVGSTILSAFLNRRAPSASSIGTAVRRTSNVGKEQGDVGRAREALAQVEGELAALQAELERELAALAGEGVHAEALELETISVRPTSRDVALRYVGLAWVPYELAANGRWTEAW